MPIYVLGCNIKQYTPSVPETRAKTQCTQGLSNYVPFAVNTRKLPTCTLTCDECLAVVALKLLKPAAVKDAAQHCTHLCT
jgi:hypothetical protein